MQVHNAEPTLASQVLAEVCERRLEADVRALTESPRHVQDDHAAALAAAAWVGVELTQAGLSVRELMVSERGVSLPVVLSELPGRRDDLAFVVCAHYDTVRGTPGADDNASGVAGVVERGRVLAAVSLPMTLVLAAVPFEEGDSMQPGDALFPGAQALAQDACSTRRVVGMVSLEMIGVTSPDPDGLLDGPQDYLALVGDLGATQLVGRMAEAAAAIPGLPRVVAAPMAAEPYPLVMPVDGDLSGLPTPARSDHAAFWSHGIPAAMATDTANFRNRHYHTAEDAPDTLDYAFMAGAVRAVAAGILSVMTEQAQA